MVEILGGQGDLEQRWEQTLPPITMALSGLQKDAGRGNVRVLGGGGQA